MNSKSSEQREQTESTWADNYFRVCVVGDKDPHNLRRILGRSVEEKSALDFAGLIIPGGDIERDFMLYQSLIVGGAGRNKDIVGYSRHVGTNEFQGFGLGFSPGVCDSDRRLSPVEMGALMEARMKGKFNHSDFSVLPYTKAQFKPKGARKRYMQVLLNEILGTRPNVVFLSNFKLILDPAIPETLSAEGIQLINVHPSVLPEMKGWRTEKRGLLEDGDVATGYTFHRVVPELDAGPVLFARKIPVTRALAGAKQDDIDLVLSSNGDATQASVFKVLTESLEERAREMMIADQSQYTPDVLEILAHGYPEKSVKDSEAFVAEGRPNFCGSAKHLQSLKEDYAHWKKENKDNDLCFENWKKSSYRIPYERILFDAGEGFQTIEEILGVSDKEYVEIGEIPYEFSIILPTQSFPAGIADGYFSIGESGVDKIFSSNGHAIADGYKMVIKTPQREAVLRWINQHSLEFTERICSPSVIRPRRGSMFLTS